MSAARDSLRERVAKALGDYYRHAGGVVLRSDERKADAILSALLSPENRPLLLEVLNPKGQQMPDTRTDTRPEPNFYGEWMVRDNAVYYGDYANEGEPDALIEVTASETPGELAALVARLLNEHFGKPE